MTNYFELSKNEIEDAKAGSLIPEYIKLNEDRVRERVENFRDFIRLILQGQSLDASESIIAQLADDEDLRREYENALAQESFNAEGFNFGELIKQKIAVLQDPKK